MSALLAIVGRPNVGKSTLFNRLVGYKKAIVDDMPGVTRDRNYAPVEIGGQSVTLVDTGGFDADDKDGLMALVREQTRAAIEESDLIVFLADGRQGLSPHDRELADLLRKSERPFILAVNKIDGPEHDGYLSDFFALGLDEILPLSAAHGYGIKGLLARVEELLPLAEESPPEENLIRVAIVGRPNVGKSSLLNRLIGQERALVTDIPGTTRDPLDVEITRRGQRYRFVDTAGIRRKGKVSFKVEKFAVMRALRSLDRCDVALILIDSTEGVTEQDAHVAGYAVQRGRAPIFIFNKWDLVRDKRQGDRDIRRGFDLKLRFLAFAPRLTMSALTGQGVDRIFKTIRQVFDQYQSRFPTGQVNRILEKAVESHTPPYVGRKRLKFYYATQAATRPPRFFVFTNRPDNVHFSYQRYLSNTFKQAFGLDKTPVEIYFRARHKERHKKE